DQSILYYTSWYVFHQLVSMASLSKFQRGFSTRRSAQNAMISRCFEEINSLIPVGFGAPFAMDSVNEMTKRDVARIVESIRDELLQSFNNSVTMDTSTKIVAFSKLQKMQTVISIKRQTMEAIHDMYA